MRIGPWELPPVGLGGVHWSIADERDDELSIATIRAAIEAGIRLIDTAHAYTTLDETSHNESIVRRALAGHPLADQVLVATKGGHWRKGYADFPIDGRPETLRAHLEESLRTLGVESIGLYQLHHPDPAVPIEESVGTIAEFQAEGLVRLIGVSNFDSSQVARARTVARIASVQNSFSPFRTVDRDLITELDGESIAYLAHSPFGGLPGAERLGAALPATSALAESRGWSVHRAVVAWEIALGANVIPIVGARRPASILDSASGGLEPLDAEAFGIIDAEIAGLRAEPLP